MLTQIDQITHLTFDCYGTLIDWESGILNALQSFLEPRRLRPKPEQLLRLYVANEARIEALGWKPYRLVLQEILAGIADEFEVSLGENEQDLLANSLAFWPPFPDTVPALRRLKQRFRLVVLSNIDDELFAETSRRLEIRFDEVITAEQVRGYKPAELHFREALYRLQVPAAKILHVAQSLYHDHVPARRLGFKTARVNRPSRLGVSGLAPSAAVETDLQVENLDELADLLG